MGTVIRRKRKDGTIGYMARLRIMRNGETYAETETFDRKAAAQTWLTQREAELSQPGAFKKLRQSDPPLAEVIDQYIRESKKAIGRTKAQVLNAIKKDDIAGLACSNIDTPAVLAFAQRIGKNAKPQTVSNYLSHLSAVFAIARPAWGYPLDHQAIKDAFVVGKKLGVTGKSQSRDRRPTLDELDRIMAYFGAARQKRPASNPMQHLVAFAIFSTRRQEEITRIRWEDLDVDGKRVLVRDLKHPGEKIGNDVWCDLPQPALDIIAAMPRTDREIFPYSAQTISTIFARAILVLGIEDLTFHDLRHEGASRLFEMGLNIPHVAAVTGHRSWNSLKRYTHMRQTGDKYANWKWLSILSAPVAPVERKIVRGAEWYQRHASIFDPAQEGRDKKGNRPAPVDQDENVVQVKFGTK